MNTTPIPEVSQTSLEQKSWICKVRSELTPSGAPTTRIFEVGTGDEKTSTMMLVEGSYTTRTIYTGVLGNLVAGKRYLVRVTYPYVTSDLVGVGSYTNEVEEIQFYINCGS